MQLLENNQLESCCICSQIAGQSDNDLISNMLSEETYTRRVILENEHFVVIPSLGALVPGHVIICPRVHLRSFAQLSDKVYSSFFSIKERLLGVLGNRYRRKIHFFEHGSAKENGKLICTVDHAHIHALPTNVEVVNLIQADYSWNSFKFSLEYLKQKAGNEEYLYYESPSDGAFMCLNEGKEFPSQYLRKIFADSVGRIGDWNWRNNPDPVFAHKIYSELIE